ncbi:MAG: DUF2795 domain-containing protein [Deltaproteobacteria bacterium]|nr:DUF2795 domain-containing protein [Deltaproteobacteria bacterium]
MTLTKEEIGRYLRNLNYPATREDIVQNATEQGADEELLDAMRRLPSRQYNAPVEINQALGDVS